jgi:hypothetical protein
MKTLNLYSEKYGPMYVHVSVATLHVVQVGSAQDLANVAKWTYAEM